MAGHSTKPLKGFIMLAIMSPEEEAAQRRRDEQIEIEMLTDESLPKSTYSSAAEGIARMERRIEYLERCRKELHPDAGDQAEIDLLRDIAAARKRLAFYQSQHQARN
jgi:hypothetical protein